MMDMLIEAVVMAFMIGGIVGAAVALSLKAHRALGGEYDAANAELLQPVRVRPARRYRR